MQNHLYINSQSTGSKTLVPVCCFLPYFSLKELCIHSASLPMSLLIPKSFHCRFLSCQYPCLVSSMENGGTINLSTKDLFFVSSALYSVSVSSSSSSMPNSKSKSLKSISGNSTLNRSKSHGLSFVLLSTILRAFISSSVRSLTTTQGTSSIPSFSAASARQ